ncbi:MAG TPA: DUF4431 domain-containing protein, partial [Bacteroidia bacterium]|nr:DUF4431 domain-containing protein [Bacteroidia bacterium]
TGFGPAPGGDPKSDSREAYYVIWPSSKIDVIATPEQEKTGTVSEHNVDRVQLAGDKAMITPLLNKKVKITGTLSHASTPHQFTKVILNVKTIEAEN